jgi:hypothetical protein
MSQRAPKYRLHKGELPDVRGPPGSTAVRLTRTEGISVAEFQYVIPFGDETKSEWVHTHQVPLYENRVFTARLLQAALTKKVMLDNAPTWENPISYQVAKNRYAVQWEILFPPRPKN